MTFNVSYYIRSFKFFIFVDRVSILYLFIYLFIQGHASLFSNEAFHYHQALYTSFS